MDKSIYERRAKDLSELIKDRYANILGGAPIDEDDYKAYRQDLNELLKFLEAEEHIARVLLAIDAQDLDRRKQDLAEQTSFEEHEVAEAANSIREKELEIKHREIDVRDREADIHAFEAANTEREIANKSVTDARKLEVEREAVRGRMIDSAAKVACAVLGIAGTVIGLRAIMRYENDAENGGIIPAKLLSVAMRGLKG